MDVDTELYNNVQTTTAITGLFSIVVVLLSIILVWTLLQVVKWETFFHFPRSPKARMLRVVIAIVLGNMIAKFILEYWGYTVMLKSFVE